MNTSTLQRPVRLGRIGYMNVAPVYYGLDNGLNPSWIHMVGSPPNTLNGMMAEGSLDISPVSAAAYARNTHDWLILPDLAVTSRERVMSVLLASRYDLEALNEKRIVVTNESSSGRDLCRLILTQKGICPKFVIADILPPAQLSEKADAALVIGDKALSYHWQSHFPHVYDLGTLWWNMTGLPFVFAVWTVRKQFAASFPDKTADVACLLKTSYNSGNEHRTDIVRNASRRLGIASETATLYYQSLGYHLGTSEKAGLTLFCDSLYEAGILEHPVTLECFDSNAAQHRDPWAAHSGNGGEASDACWSTRIPITA